MNLRSKVYTIVLAAAVPCAVCLASTTIVNKGNWPRSWPKALEDLRDRAKTLYVGWGNQENVYEIPFESREEFEAAWPNLLSLRSEGSPIILQAGPTQYYHTGPTIKAGVFILGPSGGGPLLPDGTMLRSGPPWPASSMSASGELPEYVAAEHGTWVPYAGQTDVGFHHRARVDIVLVIDGQVVNTNRIAFPKSARLIPGHFQN